jgi:hypothetical protein
MAICISRDLRCGRTCKDFPEKGAWPYCESGSHALRADKALFEEAVLHGNQYTVVAMWMPFVAMWMAFFSSVFKQQEDHISQAGTMNLVSWF